MRFFRRYLAAYSVTQLRCISVSAQLVIVFFDHMTLWFSVWEIIFTLICTCQAALRISICVIFNVAYCPTPNNSIHQFINNRWTWFGNECSNNLLPLSSSTNPTSNARLLSCLGNSNYVIGDVGDLRSWAETSGGPIHWAAVCRLGTLVDRLTVFAEISLLARK